MINRVTRALLRCSVLTVFFGQIVVFAAVGDRLAESNFREQSWRVYSKKGELGALQQDTAQNRISLKDRGNVLWYFEGPAQWLPNDGVSLYNSTIEIFLITVEWTGVFQSDFDIILVSKKPIYSLGLKGLKSDGDTTRRYTVRVHEAAAAWEHVTPGKFLQEGGRPRRAASKHDLITCLKTLTAIRVRGGYYDGPEKTQLRSIVITQGRMADEADRETPAAAGGLLAAAAASASPSSSSSTAAAAAAGTAGGAAAPASASAGGAACGGGRTAGGCGAGERMELVFAAPGRPCRDMVELSSGTLAAGGGVAPYDLVRLDPLAAAPAHNYYTGKTFVVTSGRGLGSTALVRHYVGRLSWETSTGITDVTVIDGGRACQTAGRLAAVGGGGDGFVAEYVPGAWAVAEVRVRRGGAGCGTGARQGFAPTIAAGAITAVTVTGTGSGYVAGRVLVKCLPPCTGSGLVATCAVNGAGSVVSVTVTAGGSLHSAAAPPILFCPDGTISAAGADGNDMGMAAVLSAAGGGIDMVLVTQGGVSSGPGITLRPSVNPTCVGFILDPLLSGSLTPSSINILSPGSGYTSPPILELALGGIGSQGCDGFQLLAQTGKVTADALQAGAARLGTSLTLSAAASSEDGFYTGMTLLIVQPAAAAGAQPTLTTAAVTGYEGGSKVARVAPLGAAVAAGAGYVITRAPAQVLEGPMGGGGGGTVAAALAGAAASALTCACAPAGGGATVYANSAANCSGLAVTCNGRCTCQIQLGSRAPAQDGLFDGETIYFMTGASRAGSAGTGAAAAKVISYIGATRMATLAVFGSQYAGVGEELAASQTVAIGALYVLSASFLATLAGGPNLNQSAAGSGYSLMYEDMEWRLDSALLARPFLCDQPVSNNPPGPWLPLSTLARPFGFLSTPLIGSAAALTVSAEARGGGYDEDILFWNYSAIRVQGEKGETLGTLFSDSELFAAAEEGAPISDSIAISAEKMIDMSADGNVIFFFSTLGKSGQIRFRSMRLSFLPTALLQQTIATDAYAGAAPAAPSSSAAWPVNLTRAGPAAAPSADGVLSVTFDGALADAAAAVALPGGRPPAPLQRHWLWGQGSAAASYSAAPTAEPLQVPQPADAATVCSAAGVCAAASAVAPNRTRTGQHSARVPRAVLADLVAGTGPAGGADGLVVQLTGISEPGTGVKASPITVTYPLCRCYMDLLTPAASQGPLFRQPLERPAKGLMVFGNTAPPPAAAGILWVRAAIPPQPAPGPSRAPELGAVGVRAGDNGEIIGWLFAFDYSQYALEEGVVDSLIVPRRILAALAPRLQFTLTTSAGAGGYRLLSAVISYPADTD